MLAASGGFPADLSMVPSRFDVLEELGAPGGLRLWRAHDRLLLREVLLKLPAARLPGLGSPAVGGVAPEPERSLREARALARIHHPAVQRLFDVLGTPAGPLLVLEPVAGETLAVRLEREGRLQPDEVIDLGVILAQALEVVHAAEVMHRGISSECILLSEGGQVTLTGFEFAKPNPPRGPGAPSSLVRLPGALASARPAHSAPEQQLGHQDDPRSDLFALGWVLFECLTAAPPYPGTDPAAWKAPQDARAQAPATPLALARVLALCLSPSPAQRPSDAGALRRALEGMRVDSGSGTLGARAGASPERVALRRRRLWTGVAVGAGALLLYLLAGGPLPAPLATGARGVELVGSGGGGSASRPRRVEPLLAPRYASSYALLIGIGSAYASAGFPALPNAERDLEAVAAALRTEKGSLWDIRVLRGQEAALKPLVQALVDLTRRTKPDDRVLIYFAGHGMAHGTAADSGFVIPADGVPDQQATWVRFSEFIWPFKEAKAKHILVAMDCCYGGLLTSVMRGADSAYAERFLTTKAHVVLTSGRPNERVSDGQAGANSPFTKAFVEALAVRGRPLTSAALFTSIVEDFTRDGIDHTPVLDYADGARGEFVFFRGD